VAPGLRSYPAERTEANRRQDTKLPRHPPLGLSWVIQLLRVRRELLPNIANLPDHKMGVFSVRAFGVITFQRTS
jgi:hypothetical protein